MPTEETCMPVGETFLRHAHTPQHQGCLANAHGRAEGVGSCGDRIELTLRLEGDVIAAIGHLPRGCEFTVACASAVSVLALGKTREEALAIQPEDLVRELGGLPDDHHHCARLAVNTLGEAIADTYRSNRTDLKVKESKNADI